MAQFCSRCGKSVKDTARFCPHCGEPIVQVLQAGMKLDRDRYEVLKPLKSGGMGAVYLLHDRRLERSCVLKEMVPPSHDPADLKEFRERFRNEALTLSKLSHPNLPPVYDHFEENHQCCLVMEYIEGDDLESLLAAQTPKGFPEERVRQWALTICSILEYLHSQKPLILYRDLKPSNIMLRKRDERLFLIDFGIAKSVHQALTHKTSWGTEGYAPIEQCQGEPEVRSDLYALAATMHHLLSGRPPVPFKFPAIRLLRPDVSSEMEAVLEKALKLNADERYGTALEMRAALEGVGQSAKSQQSGASIIPHSVPPNVQAKVVSPIPISAPPRKYVSIFKAIEQNDLQTVQHLISSGTNVNCKGYGGKTPLHCVAEKGYRDIAELLIENGADVNAFDYFHSSRPLHIAARHGHFEIVKLMIENGSDIYATDGSEIMPLHLASAYGHEKTVEFLIEGGASVNAAKKGLTPLHLAALCSRNKIVDILTSNNADITATISAEALLGWEDFRDLREIYRDKGNLFTKEGFSYEFEKGVTVHHCAAAGGLADFTRYLITQGADVNAATGNGTTPLHCAAIEGHRVIAELLIKNGANINAVDNSEYLPLHYAAMKGYKEIVDLLLMKGADSDKEGMLRCAVSGGLRDFVSSLISKGADINMTGDNGVSLIHSAAEKGHSPVVELLVEKGADVNATDKDDTTPLHYAAKSGHSSVIQFLVKKGAHVNAANKSGATPLHLAAREGHGWIVDFLISEGADSRREKMLGCAAQGGLKSYVSVLLDQGADVNPAGTTPLHRAAEKGHSSIAELLLAKGANVNAIDNSGRTPLHEAVEKGHFSTIKLLIEKGADVNIADNNGSTPLKKAIRNYYCENNTIQESIAALLIENNADVNTVFEVHHVYHNGSRSLLIEAISKGLTRTAELLITKGANVNFVDTSIGETPLHEAAKEGYIEIAELLISHGANINAVLTSGAKSGDTPLHWAIWHGHVEIAELLIDKGIDLNLFNCQSYSSLHLAVLYKQMRIIELLLDKGADINACDDSSRPRPPLVTAVTSGNKEIVEFLISRGANIHSVIEGNLTMLHFAAMYYNQETVEFLISQGLDINAKNDDGLTPLHLAISDISRDYENGEISFEDFHYFIECLTDEGADVNAADNEGKTPLHFAIEENQYDIVELLIEAGSDVNVSDKNGWTPLHSAAEKGNSSIVKMLLHHGADVNAADNEGNTPLHFAVGEDQYDIAELLIEAGTNVNVANKNGRTALHSAAEKGDSSIVELLIDHGADINAEDNKGYTPYDLAEGDVIELFDRLYEEEEEDE